MLLTRLSSIAGPRMALAVRSSYARLSTGTAEKVAEPVKKHWLHSAEFWGFGGAVAGWGLMGSAIYDAMFKGPEVISLNMTPVQIVYSSLFARWGFVVRPQNMLLCACHVSNSAPWAPGRGGGGRAGSRHSRRGLEACVEPA